LSDALAYFRAEHPRTFELAAWTREMILAAEPEFGERVYRGWRGVGFRHPEAGYVCAIFPKDDHVELLFEHGASLADPEGRLEGGGTQTRLFAVRSSDADTEQSIRELVQQAVAQRLLDRG
jgi:hypothetical protein